MKLVMASGAIALALGFAGSASAQSVAQNYTQINIGSGVAGTAKISAVAAGVGSGSVSENAKAGIFGSALVGHSYGNGVSMEVEAYYGANNLHTGDLNALLGGDLDARSKSYGALANLKLEAPKPYVMGDGLSVAPYIAAGAGYGGATYRLVGLSDSDSGFTWQVKAGLAFHTKGALVWDLGYRYLSAAKYKFEDGAGTSLSARTRVHAVTLGARFPF